MYTKIESSALTTQRNQQLLCNHRITGLVNRQVRFGSLATCIDAACNRVVSSNRPTWLGHLTHSETKNGKVNTPPKFNVASCNL